VLVFTLLVASTALAIGTQLNGRKWFRPFDLTRTAIASPNTSLQKNDDISRNPIEVENIDMASNGFEPREIRRPAGPFMLFVHNGIDFKQGGPLLLKQEGGGRVLDVILKEKTLNFTQVLNLPVGTYSLTYPRLKDFNLTITITAR
jgi:hypothetical protein